MGIEHEHAFPKLTTKSVNSSDLIRIASYERKAVGIQPHGINKCRDSKVHVRPFLFKFALPSDTLVPLSAQPS